MRKMDYWMSGIRNLALAAMLALTTASSIAHAAESFNARLEKGNAVLRSGDPDNAIAQYHDLQTEEPESEVLYYDIGCAQYGQGMKDVDAKAAEDAITAFQEAKGSFEKVLGASDPEIRANAAFNHANCVAEIAMQSAAAQKYQETVDAFKESVAEYERFLKEHPGHQDARNNLDHMRYLLKSMLQNPPPPQDQQQQQQCNKKGDEKQQQDKSQQNQKDADQKEEKKEDQQKDKDQQKQDQQQQMAKQDQAEEAQAQPKDDQNQENAKPEDKQNVDAILQSLEDIDKREQKENRNPTGNVKMKRDWW